MITKKSPAGRPGKVGKPGSNRRKSNLTAPQSHSQEVDVFALAKATYTILDLWRMLGLPGEPKLGMNFSPLREERRPSFSIYDGGRKFKDHGGAGDQGDVIAFVQAATGWTHAEIRDYFMERLGIDHTSKCCRDAGGGKFPTNVANLPSHPSKCCRDAGGDKFPASAANLLSQPSKCCRDSGGNSNPASAVNDLRSRDAGGGKFPASAANLPSQPFTDCCVTPGSLPISWPSELATGSSEMWDAFAKLRGYSYPAVWTMAQAGILRFCVINKHKCIAITDSERRSAEIRRVDGGLFGGGSKAYPLKGVDKSWLVGAALLDDDADVLITEGATDLLAAYDLYCRYRRAGGQKQWCPMALLGSKCKRLDPGILEQIKGRQVRLIPDGDDDGDIMRDTWAAMLTKVGCTVDVVRMPRGKDLSDMAGEIQPEEVFA